MVRDAGSCTCAADAEAPTQCRLSTGSRVEKKVTNEHGRGGCGPFAEYQNVIVSFECPCVVKKRVWGGISCKEGEPVAEKGGGGMMGHGVSRCASTCRGETEPTNRRNGEESKSWTQ